MIIFIDAVINRINNDNKSQNTANIFLFGFHLASKKIFLLTTVYWLYYAEIRGVSYQKPIQ